MSAKYQLFDDLTEKAYQALKDDIETRGIIVPIEVDENGDILDGHHRVKAWKELVNEKKIKKGDQYNRIVRANMSEQEKRNHVRALNIIRRHLSKEDQQKMWKAMREDGATYEAIAEASGVGTKTVQRNLESTLSNDKVQTIGKDGKKRKGTYTKRKPKPVVMVKSEKEQERAVAAIAKVENLPDKTLDLKRVERIAREEEASKKAETVDGDVKKCDATLLLGDMRERGSEIPDESIDLIFTDPPYPEEFLSLWTDLSLLASRVLKPSGMLIAYSGAMYLPTVIRNLGEHLDFWWCGAIVLDGPHSRVHGKNVMQGSKPLLFYVRKGFEPSNWFKDTFKSEKEDKTLHDWEQNIAAATYYIEKITDRDATILDPFLGAGTTATASIKAGRSFYGIEIDKIAFATTKERIDG